MKLFYLFAAATPIVVLFACGSSSTSDSPGNGQGPDGSTVDPGADGGTGADGSTSNPGTDGSIVIGDAGPIITNSAVTITVEPTNDDGKALLAAINAATTSIHMEMYLLTLQSVVTALIAKAAAGVDVQVILNKTFPDTEDSNTAIMAKLTASPSKVKAVWASDAFTYTHEKSIVFDGKTAWIMTANATASSYDSNREYLAVDTTQSDVDEVEAIFAADYAQAGYTSDAPKSTPTIPGSLVVAPAPPMNSLPDIIAFISSAKTSVYAEVEEIDSVPIADAFVKAVKNGATVDFVVSNSTDNTTANGALTVITQNGGKVYVSGGTESSSTQSNPYIHAKAIVVDGTSAWIGSENFTTGSVVYNREVGVFFSTPSEVQKVMTAIQADVAAGKAL